MDKSSLTALRLRLLANGYSPIRNRDKRTFMSSWPTKHIDEAEIKSWERMSRDRATGLRIENGLVAIDLDVDDPIIDEIADAAMDAVPALDGRLPIRKGKGLKEAWFVRLADSEEPFSRIFTRGWVRPGEGQDAQSHRVEIFGGGSHRQFGAFGPHTVDEQGEVLVEYRWGEASPLDTPLADLPVLTKQDCFTIVDTAERILKEHGWEPIKLSTHGEGEPGRVYDLEEAMVFECNDGVTRTLAELRAAAEGDHLRCSASWLEGPTAVNTSRCLVSLTRSGSLAIWESAAGVTHLEKELAPKDYGLDIDRVSERLREIEERRRNKIRPDDPFETTVAKMLNVYAYCPNQQNDVVPIWATSPDQGMALSKFRTMLLPNAIEEVGPRGGTKLINPVDVWSKHERRMTVQGLRMRPDKERPVYTDEDGRAWINVYTPPVHAATGGEVQPFLDFLVHLIPNEKERRYVLQWLAFKHRYPHIPGPALVFVAHGTFGTGRGTLGEIISRLFGRAYVRMLPFTMFTGKTYQSQYNEWMADALVAIVNESSETTDGSRYQTKQNTYEHLKEMVDPRPLEREIMVKGRPNYRAVSSTSFIIATNHADALPIPEHDRRFAVIRNGGTKPEAYWEELHAWLERPESIAAVAQYLSTVDLAGYSPFAPPPTFEGKLRMIEESKSDLDVGFEEALESLVSEVFTVEQIVKIMHTVETAQGLRYANAADLPAIVRRLVRRSCHRVGVRHGANWFLKHDGKRVAVYAKTHDGAARWSQSTRLREEVEKNGPLFTGASGGASVILGAFPKE